MRWALGSSSRGQLGRYGLILLIDAAFAAAALAAAVVLRFDGAVPAAYLAVLPAAALLLAASRVACNAVAGLHSWSFRLAGLPDAVRIGMAGLAGSLLATPAV